jgi:dephospho-CoA kinase
MKVYLCKSNRTGAIKMKVIALTGMPGSGKSVVTEVLKTEGYETVYMGNIVRNEIAEKNIEPTSKNVRNYATDLRKQYGDDIIAKRCIPELKEKLTHSKSKAVIIEDIKGIAEVECFRKELGEDFQLIAIHASPRLRYERSLKRPKEWDNKAISDFSEFQWRDKKEMSWGLGEAIALADYIVTNDSTEEELIKKIRSIFKQIEV